MERDPSFRPRPELVHSVEQELGRGGVGSVHLVTDHVLGRRAALKLLLARDPHRAARFRREAVLTARLDHPGIPPVYAAGTRSDGQPFLLMRYIRGRSLAQLLREPAERRPRSRELLDGLVKAAEAVAYAHSRGVVHRDLKPDNLMLGDFGETLVVDWGLARELEQQAKDQEQTDLLLRRSLEESDRPGLTQEGALLGTLGYIPPEQVRGEAVGPQVDVFALGAVLTEILTGSPPIEGDSPPSLIVATVDGRIETPRQRLRSVPGELNSIAARALAFAPEQRYASAREFAADLRAYLQGDRVGAHRYRLSERLGRLARQTPALTALGLAACLAGLGGLIVLAMATARGVASEQRRLVAEARAELAALGSGAQSQAQALSRLAAAGRWQALARDDARAAEAHLTAAGELAEWARERREWSLAEAALREPRALTPQLEARRAQLQAELRADRRAEEARQQSRYQELFEVAAEQGGRDRAQLSPALIEDAVYALVLIADPALAEDMFQRLSAVSARLEAVRSEALAEAARPREGRPTLDGVEAAFAWLAGQAPGSPLNTAQFEVALEACRRLVKDARDEQPLVDDEEMLALGEAVIAARQNQALAPQDLAVAELGCRVLPRLSGLIDGERVERALVRYLTAQADPARSLGAAEALAVHGAPESLRFVRAGLRRYGHYGLYDQRIMGVISRRRDVAPRVRAGEVVELGELFERGSLMIDRGDWRGAVTCFAAIVEHDPDNAGAWANLGLARCMSGDVEQGLEAFDAALRLPNAQTVAILVNRAGVLEDLGRGQEALADLDRALALDPTQGIAWNVRGNVLMSLGDPEGARASFDRSLELGPENAQAWANRARLRIQLGDVEGGLGDYDQAIALAPGSAQLRSGRAGVYFSLNRLTEAKLDAEEAVRLDPNDSGALAQLGLAYAGEGRLEQGAELLLRATRTGPPTAMPWINLANVRMRQARYEDALAAIGRGLAIESTGATGVQAFTMRAYLRHDLGQLEGAWEDAAAALKIAPDFGRAWLVRGRVQLSRLQLAPAKRDLQRAWQLTQDSVALLDLAFLALLSGDTAGARQQFLALEGRQPIAGPWAAALGGRPQGLRDLAEHRVDLVGALARFYLGELDEAGLLAAVEREGAEASWARGEARVHLALRALRSGDQDQARALVVETLKSGKRTSQAYLVAIGLAKQLGVEVPQRGAE